MRHLKLIQVFLKVNLQMALAYRADTLMNMLVNLMWLGWELLSLTIIFSNTQTLAGWQLGELIILLGVFRIITMLMFIIIWPATEKFNSSIRDGSFDYVLLQPVNSLFVVSFSRITVWRVWDLLLAIILITAGMNMTGEFLQPLNLFFFVLLTLSGILIIYSLWVFLIALTFWFIKFDNNVTILHALLDAGRYPVMVYPYWLQVIVTFIIPVAVATTVPVQALQGVLAGQQIIMYLLISVISLIFANVFWKFGIKKYSGASS
jgi:ABC-2 type transport system permease protein